MNGLVRVLAALGLAGVWLTAAGPTGPMTGAASAQTIERRALAPLEGAGVRDGVDQGAERPRGQDGRVPFKSYHNVFGPFLPERIEEAALVSRGGTKLRQLDKMTGRIRTLYIPAGLEASLDRLTVQVETCRTRGEDGAGGAISFLRIWDARNEVRPVFAGWMFAGSPALSALDHPRYDVWVISCIAKSGGAPSASE